MFGGSPPEVWCLCHPVICTIKWERLHECVHVLLLWYFLLCPEASLQVSHCPSSKVSEAPGATRQRRALKLCRLRLIGSCHSSHLSGLAGSSHSWLIFVADTAYFLWHISDLHIFLPDPSSPMSYHSVNWISHASLVKSKWMKHEWKWWFGCHLSCSLGAFADLTTRTKSRSWKWIINLPVIFSKPLPLIRDDAHWWKGRRKREKMQQQITGQNLANTT